MWLLPWALQPGLPPQLARAGAGRAAGEGPYYCEPLLALPHRVPPSCGQGLEARLALWASAAAPLRGAQRGQGWARRCARPAASAREMGPSAAPGPWPRCSRIFLASVKWGSQGQRGAGGAAPREYLNLGAACRLPRPLVSSSGCEVGVFGAVWWGPAEGDVRAEPAHGPESPQLCPREGPRCAGQGGARWAPRLPKALPGACDPPTPTAQLSTHVEYPENHA